MTTAELISMTRSFLAYDLDAYQGESPTDAEVVAALNWGLRSVSRRVCVYDPSVELTLVAGQASYDLRGASLGRRVVKPLTVVVNGNPLRTADGRAYGMYSMAELDLEAPAWRTAAGGTPRRAVHHGTTLLLNPAPTQAVVDAGDNYVAGHVLASDLSSDEPAAEPELPEELHECLAYFAAVRSAMPNVTEQEGWARLKAYQESWQAAVDEVRRENIAQMSSWGTTSGAALGPDFMAI